MTESPLDRPISSALTQAQAPLAEINGAARRYPADMARFAATADLTPASLADLVALMPAEGGLALFEDRDLPAPPGLAVVRHASVHQMIAPAVSPSPASAPASAPALGIAPGFAPLGENDVADMLELVHLTDPGPFAARTHRLGRYLGLRREGRLVAMAGERMRLDGFTEISAVCTHPDARGQGLGAQAVTAIANLIRAGGGVPFLHVFANNAPAIALYERLGFTLRRELRLTVLRRAG